MDTEAESTPTVPAVDVALPVVAAPSLGVTQKTTTGSTEDPMAIPVTRVPRKKKSDTVEAQTPVRAQYPAPEPVIEKKDDARAILDYLASIQTEASLQESPRRQVRIGSPICNCALREDGGKWIASFYAFIDPQTNRSLREILQSGKFPVSVITSGPEVGTFINPRGY